MVMLTQKNPTETRAWKALNTHFRAIRDVTMTRLFQEETDRFSRFSISFQDIFLDYSKNRITSETMRLLLDLALEMELKPAIEAMFTGDIINVTENRPVLHTALRNRSGASVRIGGEDVMPHVDRSLKQMERFCGLLRQKRLKGYTGKPITDIVNLGIGGSDLGPAMVCQALTPYASPELRFHFVSNVDGSHLTETLKQVSPEQTLFIVASKSFTTLETMTNARSARRWFLERADDETHISRHFVAVTSRPEKANEFGIPDEHVFAFRDWVGGRYSIWSSIGLPIACRIGYDQFIRLLEGAHAMDLHFRNESLNSNIPVILALLGIWYNNFFKAPTHAVIPYDQYLGRLPAYLQQADMESNGKNMDRAGNPVSYTTGPVIWGEPGTNGQHAFFQLIHQGTQIIPCDFILPAVSHNPVGKHHDILAANCLAQSEALMRGKDRDTVLNETAGEDPGLLNVRLPYRTFQGNRPSNTILTRQITPFTLGMLIAMYEHKIFVQGVIWNIYSFDQWGVELGKQLAGKLLHDFEDPAGAGKHDSSTTGLIHTYLKMRKG
jgi:glucose-6-phosphate isomerase